MKGRARTSRSAARHRHAAIAGHRSALLEADCDERLGIPVTSPARTLADLAHVLPLDDLVRAFREAQFLRLYDRKALQDALTRRPSTRLKELMEDAAITQSDMEDAFKRICVGHNLPMPHTQYRLGAKTYDFAWPELRLIVEADSWLAHGTPYAFQADRTTSNHLQLKGWMVLRFTWQDVTRRRRHVAAQVRSALRRDGSRRAG